MVAVADPLAGAPIDYQADFSGGANGVTPPQLLAPNEVALLKNAFATPGGGLDARGGYKFFADAGSQGTGILEMNQSTGTVMTYEAIPNAYYDESMSPR